MHSFLSNEPNSGISQSPVSGLLVLVRHWMALHVSSHVVIHFSCRHMFTLFSVVRSSCPFRSLTRSFHNQLLNLLTSQKTREKVLEKCHIQTRTHLTNLLNDLSELQDLKSGDDNEVKKEMGLLRQRILETIPTVREELLLHDEDNAVDRVLLEVICGVGGQEAMLFAAELVHVYQQFACSKGWEYSEIRSDESDLGGVKSYAAQIAGESCFNYLRHEAGVHRVQRIPRTEKSGRVHTSTVAVHVIPVLPESDVVIDKKDLQISTSRSTGAGGQHVNKTESCILIKHLPTGIQVECQEERSQIRNKEIALQKLRQILMLREKEKIISEYQKRKKIQVSSLSRSEKIRTYNFPQDRITDHRLSENVHDLKSFMRGDADRMTQLIQQLGQKAENEYIMQIIKSLSV